MVSTVIRLLALIAMLAMPLGMATTPALAASIDHHAMTDAGHCDQNSDEDKAPSQTKMDCTAACTALPASPAPASFSALKPMALRTTSIVRPFTGIVPEIETPPPRLG